MQFLVVNALEWDWHPTVLKIKDVAINKEHEKERLLEIKIDSKDKKISDLFDIDSFDDAEDVLKKSKTAIGFYSNNEELLKITVK